MSVSKKHLEFLIDRAFAQQDLLSGQSPYMIINIIREFGLSFCPNFDQAKFNAYLDKKESEYAPNQPETKEHYREMTISVILEDRELDRLQDLADSRDEDLLDYVSNIVYSYLNEVME